LPLLLPDVSDPLRHDPRGLPPSAKTFPGHPAPAHPGLGGAVLLPGGEFAAAGQVGKAVWGQKSLPSLPRLKSVPQSGTPQFFIIHSSLFIKKDADTPFWRICVF